ncbi:30S ribosomal protein S16 [Candidatus Dojkabacteria bacterium]|nr:30S ribosomal protein S16 [Candidatus Dojkabacteria bacterium]
MVKLRLARFGRKNIPFYRLVAIQARTKRSGEAIEYLGTYNPKLEKNKLTIKEDRIKYWLSVGAQPTDTVHHLLAKAGLVKPLKKKYKKAPGKNVKAKIEAEKSAKGDKTSEAAKENKVNEVKTEKKIDEDKGEKKERREN